MGLDQWKSHTVVSTAFEVEELKWVQRQAWSLSWKGQERVQAEGDVRDATARQSHLRKRVQELGEAKFRQLWKQRTSLASNERLLQNT